MSRGSPQLLARVCELMRLEMNTSAADALKSASDDLQALGSAATTHEEHQLLLRVRDAVAGPVRQGFLPLFEQRLQDFFDQKIGWLTQTLDTALQGHTFADFDLIDDAVLAQQMALRKLVQKTLEELDRGALVAVEIRMAEVLGVAKLEGVRNPVGPGTVLKAVCGALEELVEDEMVRNSVVNIFQPHFSAGLDTLYAGLNNVLIEAGVKPDYRPMIERDKTGRQGVRKSASGVSISQALSLRELLPGSASSPIDLGAILGALLKGAGENRQYGARMLADAGGSLYAQAIDTQVNQDLLKTLSQMQQAASLPQAGEDRVQDLQAIVQHMQKADAHPLDQLTGELVMVVFDFLLHEKALAESVKAQVARLQIVALKAALLDRSFFARREHPLRMLLNDITARGSDPLTDTQPESTFVAGLRAIVDELLAGFDNDLALFEQARERLTALGTESDSSQDKALGDLTDALLVEERDAQAEAQAADAVRVALRPDTPAFLRDFLEQHWRRVLVQARLQSSDNKEWDEGVETMEMLLSSVYPKGRQELPRFTASLPPLLGSLQKGFRALQLGEEEKKAFMDSLMNAHTAVLQGARTMEAPPPPAPPSTPAPDAPVAYHSPEYRPVRRALLPQGALVEFTDVTPPQRARLRWISPAQTRYAFIAALGTPRSFTAEELSRALAQGVVQVLQEEDSPMARAMARMVGEGETKAS